MELDYRPACREGECIMVATTWDQRSLWQASDNFQRYEDRTRFADGQAKRHELEVVEEEDRKYVISHAGILQRQTGLGDLTHHLSKGFLIFPLVLGALMVPVAIPLIAMGQYMLLVICLAHLIMVTTVLTVTAIAISYLDMQKTEESLEARPMTAADGDPSMGARSPEVRPKHAA
jgi:hypothetical protein